jgi:hypothetical protein
MGYWKPELGRTIAEEASQNLAALVDELEGRIND